MSEWPRLSGLPRQDRLCASYPRSQPCPNVSTTAGEPSDSDRVDRLSSVNLLELQAGMVRILSKQPVRLARSVSDVFRKVVVRCREARSRASSQAVWIDVRRPTPGSVGARFSGKFAELILRGFKPPGPVLVVRELVKQPAPNTVLFVGRKRLQLRDRGIQRAGHYRSIPNVGVSRVEARGTR